MGLFSFGKKYTDEDLQREIHALASLYRQAIGGEASTKSRTQLKRELARQLDNVLGICKKGDFCGWETVEWNPRLPSSGNFTSVRNVIQTVQVLLEMM